MLKKKKELGLPVSQKALLIWDDFKAQSTEDVMEELETQGIKDVPVPWTCALDLTTNNAVTKIEQCEFSNYFTSCITNGAQEDPTRDVTTIKVDLRLSA